MAITWAIDTKYMDYIYTEDDWKHHFVSIILGFALYSLVIWVWCKGLWFAFSMEVLGNYDYSFLLDDNTNQHMIVAVGIFEKFDYVTMKQYLF